MKDFITIIPDTENRKVTDVIESKVHFGEYLFICYEEFYADFEVEKSVMTEKTNEYRKITSTYLKKQITGCIKNWYWGTECWGVAIMVKGGMDNIECCFLRETEADEFITEFLNWLK